VSLLERRISSSMTSEERLPEICAGLGSLRA
jgi:hypothetical protein